MIITNDLRQSEKKINEIGGILPRRGGIRGWGGFVIKSLTQEQEKLDLKSFRHSSATFCIFKYSAETRESSLNLVLLT